MDFGRALFGPIGGALFAFMVAFSCFGALNGIVLYFVLPLCKVIFCFAGTVYTSARLLYAAGRERYIPPIFGKLHPTRHTPMNAALLQATLAVIFIMVGNGFRSLINFSVVAAWAFYFLTVRSFFMVVEIDLTWHFAFQVLGLVILRVKEPMLERSVGFLSYSFVTHCYPDLTKRGSSHL